MTSVERTLSLLGCAWYYVHVEFIEDADCEVAPRPQYVVVGIRNSEENKRTKRFLGMNCS